MKLIELQEGLQWIDASLVKQVRIHESASTVIITHGDGARTEIPCKDIAEAKRKAAQIVKQVNEADEAMREMVRASMQAEQGVKKQEQQNRK